MNKVDYGAIALILAIVILFATKTYKPPVQVSPEDQHKARVMAFLKGSSKARYLDHDWIVFYQKTNSGDDFQAVHDPECTNKNCKK